MPANTDAASANSLSGKDLEQIMRGYLLIHVGGYKIFSDLTGHIFPCDDGGCISVPDRQIQVEAYPFGTTGFYEDGWAVGNNPRDRFCKWQGIKPMRHFDNFDEAVAYTYRLRQKRKRPHEVYTLVYVTKDFNGIDRQCDISSISDIAAFEDALADEYAQNNIARELHRQQLGEEYPELNRLIEAYGMRKACVLSELLKIIRSDDPKKAMLTMPRSTFDRRVRELRKIGLLARM
jgi:hypothetical protein